MAGKITDYPTMTTLASGDLLDVSDYDGVSAFVSKSIDWDILKTNIEGQITFTNLYTADGTLAGNRIVSMGVNDLTFGSTGDANLLRFDSTSDRIGIGTAAPTSKLDVVGASDTNADFSTKFNSATKNLLSLRNDGFVHFGENAVYPSLLQGGSGFINLSNTLTPIWQVQDTNRRISFGGGGVLEMEGSATTYIQGTASGFAYAGTHSADEYRIRTNNVDRIWVDVSGNVGIGVSTITEKLEVAGNAYINGQASVNTAINPNSQFVVLGSGKITCIDGTHNSITTNNGSAVIGRATSAAAVEIYGGDFLAQGTFAGSQNTSVRGTSATAGGSNNYGAKFTANNASSQNIGVSGTVGNGSTGSVIRGAQGISIYTGVSNAYGGYFSSQGAGTTNIGLYATANTATTNYAAIFDAGNVGIGTSTPSQKLEVAGGVNVNANVTNQFYVSNTQTFVGVGTSTPLADETLRVFGKMSTSNVVSFGGASTIGSSINTPTGWRLILGGLSAFTDDVSNNSTTIRSRDSTFRVNGDNVISYFEVSNPADKSTTAHVIARTVTSGAHVGDAIHKMTASYWDGAVGQTSVGNISLIAANTTGDTKLNFNIGGSDIVTMLDNGNVGIGTSTPSQKLDVAGNIQASGAYYITNDLFLHSTVGGVQNPDLNNVLIGKSTPTGLTAGGSNATSNVAVGGSAMTAMVGGFNNVAIGGLSLSSAINTRENVAVGKSALNNLNPSTQTSAIHTTAFGSSTFTSLTDGSYNTALGGSSGVNITSGSGNTYIGALSGADSSGVYNHSIAIGRASKVTASNQMVVGASASGAHINEVFWGAGVEEDAITPIDFEMSLTNIASGNTDVSSGYDWIFNGSKGTGTGAGGDIIFKTAKSGTTGSTQNPLAEILRIKETGVLNVVNIPTAATGLVAGDIYSNGGVLTVV